MTVKNKKASAVAAVSLVDYAILVVHYKEANLAFTAANGALAKALQNNITVSTDDEVKMIMRTNEAYRTFIDATLAIAEADRRAPAAKDNTLFGFYDLVSSFDLTALAASAAEEAFAAAENNSKLYIKKGETLRAHLAATFAVSKAEANAAAIVNAAGKN